MKRIDLEDLPPVINNVSLKDIAEAACQRHPNLTMKLLLGKSSPARIAWVRFMIYFVARETTGLSLPQIGKFFGRDHSIINYGVQSVRKKMSVDPVYAAKIEKWVAYFKQAP